MRASRVLVGAAVAAACAWSRSAVADPPDEIPSQTPQVEAVASPVYQTTVVGTPAPRTASERRLDAADIAVTPHHTADDLLRVVPGLVVTRHGSEGKGHQIFLRGFDAVHGSDVEVLVGGVPVNELSNVHGQGYLDLGFVIPEAILGLDATKGSFRLDQGNFATAGSIRFALGVPQEARGTRLQYEVGSSNRHRLVAIHAPSSAPESTFLALEAMRDDGHGQNRSAERLGGMGQLVLHRSGSRRLEVFGAAYAARFGEPGTLPLADVMDGGVGLFDSYSEDTEGMSRRALAGIHYIDDTRPRTLELIGYGQWRTLSLEENFTGFLLDAAHGDRRLQTHEAASGGARARFEQRLARGLTLLTGADLHVEMLEQREDMIDENHLPWRASRDIDALQLSASARAGLGWRPFPGLRVEGGARIDVFHFRVTDPLAGRRGADTLATVSPRAVVSYALTDELTLFGAYGRGLRAPEARSVTSAGGGENQPNQQYAGGKPRITVSDAGEVGARFEHGPVEVGAAAFATFIDNEVVFDHVSGVNVELNSTRRLGGELEVAVHPARDFELRADLTRVDARFVGSGNPVPGAPTLLVTGEVRLTRPRGWHGGARIVYLAPRPLAHGAQAAGSAVLDVTAGYRFADFAVDLAVDNVLDTEWKDGEFHYASWFDRSQPRSDIPRIHYSPGPPLMARLGLTAWF